MYSAFLPHPLVAALAEKAESVPGVDGLAITPSLLQDFPDIENPEILEAVVEVAGHLDHRLQNLRVLDIRKVLEKRWGDGESIHSRNGLCLFSQSRNQWMR